MEWLGNLGECNNHKDVPPAFSLGSGGWSRLECSACRLGTKYYLCKELPAVSMSLACAVGMHRNLAGNQDVLPTPLRSQELLLLSNTATFFLIERVSFWSITFIKIGKYCYKVSALKNSKNICHPQFLPFLSQWNPLHGVAHWLAFPPFYCINHPSG